MTEQGSLHQVRKTRVGGQPGGLGHPVHHVSTSKAHRPVFDKKELNKIFKGEHSAVSRNCQLKIFCGKPGSEERALGRARGGRVVSQGCPFLAEGREVRGPPAGQHSGLGAGCHLETRLFQKKNPAGRSLPRAYRLYATSRSQLSPFPPVTCFSEA